MTAGDIFVGASTFALALFTGLLANGARHQIRLSRESIEAIDRPFIIVSRKKKHMACLSGDVMEFALNNLGKGPGIVEELLLLSSSGANLFPGHLEETRALAISNVVDLKMKVSKVGPTEGEEVKLQVRYRSASGSLYRTDSLLRLCENGRFSYHGHRRIVEPDPESLVISQ
jgi:hypothetical protein